MSAVEITLERLRRFHFHDRGAEGSNGKEAFGKLFSLYLNDIQESIEVIFSRQNRLCGFFSKVQGKNITLNNESVCHYAKYLDRLPEVLKKTSPTFLTWSHGDCHSRNIMINLSKPDLKFIDIDNLSRSGDYAYDFGSLLADLEIFNPLLQSRRPEFTLKRESESKLSYKLKPNRISQMAIATFESYVRTIAKEKSDDNFENRLNLAKARYLFHMVPKTKDAEKALVVYLEGLRFLKAVVS